MFLITTFAQGSSTVDSSTIVGIIGALFILGVFANSIFQIDGVKDEAKKAGVGALRRWLK